MNPTMTKDQMMERIIFVSKTHCSQTSEPHFFEGEGPFIIAMDEHDGTPKFFCFSFTEADEFVAQPDDLPRALQSDTFPFEIADHLDIGHLDNSGQIYPFTFMKIVPDLPACRAAVKVLFKTNAQAASLISLMRPDGSLLPALHLNGDQTMLS